MCVGRCCSWLLPVLEILRKRSLRGISDPPPRHSVMSHGLGWEKSFSRTCFSVVGSSAWLETVVPGGGGSQCPLPSSTRAAAR